MIFLVEVTLLKNLISGLKNIYWVDKVALCANNGKRQFEIIVAMSA